MKADLALPSSSRLSRTPALLSLKAVLCSCWSQGHGAVGLHYLCILRGWALLSTGATNTGCKAGNGCERGRNGECCLGQSSAFPPVPENPKQMAGPGGWHMSAISPTEAFTHKPCPPTS